MEFDKSKNQIGNIRTKYTLVYEPTYSFFLLLKNKKIIDKVFIIDLNIMKNIFNFQNLSSHKPWYKANFFISEPVLFGTWDGVFTSCLINILGVVIFLRMGWIVVSFSGLFFKMFSLTTETKFAIYYGFINIC